MTGGAMSEADPKEKLKPFAALIGDWSLEITHPFTGDAVIRGKAQFEWLSGSRFLIQRSENEHPDFPDSISVIGVMEGEDDLSMQYFDSRGVHRIYRIAFDGKELRIWRDEPGFMQRVTLKLDAGGLTLQGVWQLNQKDQGFKDDLAITYRRPAS
jgi:hypothetical protein